MRRAGVTVQTMIAEGDAEAFSWSALKAQLAAEPARDARWTPAG